MSHWPVTLTYCCWPENEPSFLSGFGTRGCHAAVSKTDSLSFFPGQLGSVKRRGAWNKEALKIGSSGTVMKRRNLLPWCRNKMPSGHGPSPTVVLSAHALGMRRKSQTSSGFHHMLSLVFELQGVGDLIPPAIPSLGGRNYPLSLVCHELHSLLLMLHSFSVILPIKLPSM